MLTYLLCSRNANVSVARRRPLLAMSSFVDNPFSRCLNCCMLFFFFSMEVVLLPDHVVFSYSNHKRQIQNGGSPPEPAGVLSGPRDTRAGEVDG